MIAGAKEHLERTLSKDRPHPQVEERLSKIRQKCCLKVSKNTSAAPKL